MPMRIFMAGTPPAVSSRGAGRAGGPAGRLDALVVHVVVGDQAHACPGRWSRRAPLGREVASRPSGRDARRPRCWSGPGPGSSPQPGQRSATASASRPGPGVVVGQPLHHRVERHQPGRGQHPGLAHGAAQALALHPAGRQQVGRAGQQRPHRGAQPLGQARHDRGGAWRPCRPPAPRSPPRR